MIILREKTCIIFSFMYTSQRLKFLYELLRIGYPDMKNPL